MRHVGIQREHFLYGRDGIETRCRADGIAPKGPGEQKKILTDNDTKTTIRYLEVLTTALETLGAHVTAIATKRLINILKEEKPNLSLKDFTEAYKDIDSRIKDELSLSNVLVLEERMAEYFQPDAPLFGKEFEDKFPSAIYELEEAAKCLALSRPTASVFHLMRLIEIAINTIATCLQIPPPVKDADRNWGEILRKIKAEMDRRNGAKPPLWAKPKDKEFFAEAYASLDAVRVAWRHTTMHVENKYSPDEAEHIFGAVRGFMKKVASRCDELGQPQA